MKLKDLLLLLLIGFVGVFVYLSYDKLNENENSSDVIVDTDEVDFEEKFFISINGVRFPLSLNENSSGGYEFYTVCEVKTGDILKFYYSDKVLNPVLEERINVIVVDENYVIDSNCEFCQIYLKLNSDGSFNLWTSGYVEKIIEDEITGYTLTLNCASGVLNSSDYTYSLDGGNTYNQFTSEMMLLENVSTIKFFGGIGTTYMRVGTTEGGADIAEILSWESDEITLSQDIIWYVSTYYFDSFEN